MSLLGRAESWDFTVAIVRRVYFVWGRCCVVKTPFRNGGEESLRLRFWRRSKGRTGPCRRRMKIQHPDEKMDMKKKQKISPEKESNEKIDRCVLLYCSIRAWFQLCFRCPLFVLIQLKHVYRSNKLSFCRALLVPVFGTFQECIKMETDSKSLCTFSELKQYY